MSKQRCHTKYCKNDPGNGTFCSTCRSRHTREADPEKYCYHALKNNAKRRGHHFTLTLQQFKKFCFKTNYLVGKGRTKTSYSIDRIDNNKGYEMGNIRLLTVSDNSIKGTKVLNFDWQTQFATVSTRIFSHSKAMPF